MASIKPKSLYRGRDTWERIHLPQNDEQEDALFVTEDKIVEQRVKVHAPQSENKLHYHALKKSLCGGNE